LLGLAGFRPELKTYVGEHNGHVSLMPREPTEDKRPYGFDLEQGGALCRKCYADGGARQQIAVLSPDGLWFLQECQRRLRRE
jgi:hypothetical protein